jgi:pimeloyl-ACP methyl ester carboxylesterase
MNTRKQSLLMVLFCTALVLPAQASDTAKEQRWADQIVDFLVDGEMRWFEADGHRFMGIYTPVRSGTPVGAVILLHGRGVHPDWPQVIQPLRTKLPEHGWATLSLQMPILDNDASYEDYVPLFKEVPARIKAGTEFLSKQHIDNVILIGHSLGANMATDYVAKHHDPRIKGVVGIGMMGKPRPAEYQPLDNVAALLRITLPVLDVYGSQTDPAILQSVDRRAFAVYHTGNAYSRQIRINGANHFYQEHVTELVQAISNWMTGSVSQDATNQFVHAGQTHKK